MYIMPWTCYAGRVGQLNCQTVVKSICVGLIHFTLDMGKMGNCRQTNTSRLRCLLLVGMRSN